MPHPSCRCCMHAWCVHGDVLLQWKSGWLMGWTDGRLVDEWERIESLRRRWNRGWLVSSTHTVRVIIHLRRTHSHHDDHIHTNMCGGGRVMHGDASRHVGSIIEWAVRETNECGRMREETVKHGSSIIVSMLYACHTCWRMRKKFFTLKLFIIQWNAWQCKGHEWMKSRTVHGGMEGRVVSSATLRRNTHAMGVHEAFSSLK